MLGGKHGLNLRRLALWKYQCRLTSLALGEPLIGRKKLNQLIKFLSVVIAPGMQLMFDRCHHSLQTLNLGFERATGGLDLLQTSSIATTRCLNRI